LSKLPAQDQHEADKVPREHPTIGREESWKRGRGGPGEQGNHLLKARKKKIRSKRR